MIMILNPVIKICLNVNTKHTQLKNSASFDPKKHSDYNTNLTARKTRIAQVEMNK